MTRFFKVLLFVFAFFGSAPILYAQQIKDGETLNLNGLDVTFRILNKEVTDVKGVSFDKYKVSATVKNNTGKSYNARLTTYPSVEAIAASKIVELNCINATGAKLTSKKLDVNMNEHRIVVTYLTMNKEGKTVNSTMTITVGYYLDPGQTVQGEANFIVPKGETPQVNVHTLQ